MAPPRKHETDVILDAARDLVLHGGPRAAGVAAISEASGAPVGTLYHRFGNRDGILSAVWLRALDRFQSGALAAAGVDSSLDGAVAMAVSAIEFAGEFGDDARLLLTIRPADLLDAESGGALAEAIRTRNVPLASRIREFSVELYGGADDRSVDAVTAAVVDLPYSAVRRHSDGIPPWLADDLATAVRAVLTAHQP